MSVKKITLNEFKNVVKNIIKEGVVTDETREEVRSILRGKNHKEEDIDKFLDVFGNYPAETVLVSARYMPHIESPEEKEASIKEKKLQDDLSKRISDMESDYENRMKKYTPGELDLLVTLAYNTKEVDDTHTGWGKISRFDIKSTANWQKLDADELAKNLESLEHKGAIILPNGLTNVSEIIMIETYNNIINAYEDIAVKNFKFNTQTFYDLFGDALEGGSNSWYYIKDLPKEIAVNDGRPLSDKIIDYVWNGGTVAIYDAEDENDFLGDFNMDNVLEAINLVKSNKEYEHIFKSIATENYDAGDTDAFFQLVVMGEIVYG